MALLSRLVVLSPGWASVGKLQTDGISGGGMSDRMRSQMNGREVERERDWRSDCFGRSAGLDLYDEQANQ